jgi:hypothetical protein
MGWSWFSVLAIVIVMYVIVGIAVSADCCFQILQFHFCCRVDIENDSHQSAGVRHMKLWGGS